MHLPAQQQFTVCCSAVKLAPGQSMYIRAAYETKNYHDSMSYLTIRQSLLIRSARSDELLTQEDWSNKTLKLCANERKHDCNQR